MVTHMESGNSSENEAGFWNDVHIYMDQYKCDKETARKEMEKIYDNYSKNRKSSNN